MMVWFRENFSAQEGDGVTPSLNTFYFLDKYVSSLALRGWKELCIPLLSFLDILLITFGFEEMFSFWLYLILTDVYQRRLYVL